MILFLQWQRSRAKLIKDYKFLLRLQKQKILLWNATFIRSSEPIGYEGFAKLYRSPWMVALCDSDLISKLVESMRSWMHRFALPESEMGIEPVLIVCWKKEMHTFLSTIAERNVCICRMHQPLQIKRIKWEITQTNFDMTGNKHLF